MLSSMNSPVELKTYKDMKADLIAKLVAQGFLCFVYLVGLGVGIVIGKYLL